jgi:ligand-binding sensor domain-containing protein/two-component sensor histidine kinase
MGTLAAVALRAGLVALILLIAAEALHAERLSITAYTVADGLPHSIVKRIVADSRGFVWFATRRGLARFDGERFLTYGVEDGLPITSVNHVLVTSSGAYWVATNGGGVCRLRTETRLERSAGVNQLRFTSCAARDTMETNRVNVLHEDRRGRIWAGSDGGLLRLIETGDGATLEPVALDLSGLPDRSVQVWAFAEDGRGALWLGTSWGLVRLVDGRSPIHYQIQPTRGADHVWAVSASDANRIWIGHDTGLIVFAQDELEPEAQGTRHRVLQVQSRAYSRRPSLPAASGEAVRIPTVPETSTGSVFALHRAAGGQIWIGSRHGLTRFDGEQLFTYQEADGVPRVDALAEDSSGHLWIAGLTGALKLARTGFVKYTDEDGLPPRIRSVFETQSGDLIVSGWPSLHRFDGKRFRLVSLNLSADGREPDLLAPVLQSRAGEWWVPGRAGLYRFPSVKALDQLSRVSPRAIYTTQDGLAGNDVFRLFEDSGGNIWIARSAPTRTILTRWDRASGRFARFTESDGLPAFSRPLAFSEDRYGAIWVGFWNGGVARYRSGGFTLFTTSDGVPPGPVGHLYSDPDGRLWLGASGGGIARIDAPQSERPLFVRYTIAQGLSSDYVTAITGDRSGRVYLGSFSRRGTVSSIDRLDPSSGRVRHYTLPPGLEGSEVDAAFRDRHGTLWFATAGGLLSLEPSPDEASVPPSIYIGSVRVGGAAYDVSALGELDVAGLELKPNDNQIEIEYFSIAAAPPVRYQYRLDGADSDWSDPTAQSSIHYAKLASGRYRFAVRAIAADGQVSVQPASLAFQIAPPFWRRWWFLMGGGMLVLVAVYGLHRFRVGRLLELERVRTRIATDLHDDIGSGLTQIAILTEIAQRRITERDPAVVEPISRVSSISRELVDSMSEIVWAINPRNDRVGDLAARMRRFASDVLDGQHIALRFQSQEDVLDLPMGAHHRRECLLVFKEAIHNAVRHARCSGVTVQIGLFGRALVLTIADNGVGFDRRGTSLGQGLRSMEARARTMGGSLEVVSWPDAGTTVRFSVLLDRRIAVRRSVAEKDPDNVEGAGTSLS